MTIVSVVLHVQRRHTHLFRDSSRRRTLHRICKELSRGFQFLAAYHSHHSERKGGAFAPHLHLIVDVPEERVDCFLDGLLHELSPRSTWRTSCEPLHQAVDLWAYALGAGRKHLPLIV
jgi:hypothetical protein